MIMRWNMRIIIVSYYFPPLGLAGTARPLALANYFAALGNEVFVVSVKPIAYPAHDESMLTQLDHRITVVRVGSTDPARLQRFLPVISLKRLLSRSAKSAAAATMFPDSKIGFVPAATRAVKRLLSPDERTLLITTSPPISAHLVGLACADESQVNWIADFRDIWSSLPLSAADSERYQKADNLLREVIGRAALVTATSPRTANTFAHNYAATSKTIFLPNGYSESDFQQTGQLEKSTIGLYGTLNDLVGFDRLAHWLGQSHQFKLQFDLKLSHIGHLDLPNLKGILSKSGLEDQFVSSGYLPHHDAVTAIRRNAVNIVSLSDQSDTSYIVPSKLWELLRAEPPLIAVLPRSNAAREILAEKKFAGVWIVDNGDELNSALESILAAPEKYRSLRTVAACSEFEWQNLFARLSDRITGWSL
jgi:glycosyltransferase involved in cell wall biosynthesis